MFQIGDHVGMEPSALVSLAAAAARTERIRLGTLVLNNDLHHPVSLAQELATLDNLSGGRLEVGLGAGHSFTEYRGHGEDVRSSGSAQGATGRGRRDRPRLLDGDPVSFDGSHYRLDRATTSRPGRGTCRCSSA